MGTTRNQTFGTLLGAIGLLAILSGCSASGLPQIHDQDNYVAPLSLSDCVSAWNNGKVSWNPDVSGRGPWLPTGRVGFIARRLRLGAGAGCGAAFDLGGGRIEVLDANGGRTVAESRKGLSYRIGLGPQAQEGMAWTREYTGGAPLAWNACQSDDGRIMLGDSCAPHNPSVSPYPFMKLQRQLTLRLFHTARLPPPTWWIGMIFQGGYVRPAGVLAYPKPGSGLATPDRNTVFYVVQRGSNAWRIAISTRVGAVDGLGRCVNWQGQGCGAGVGFEIRLVANRHVGSEHTVQVVSSHIGGDPLTPLPPDIVAAIHSGLSPIPSRYLIRVPWQ